MNISEKIVKEDSSYCEERIAVQSFHTAEALKYEIGNRVASRGQNWDLIQFESHGPFLHLIFKQRL